ncbi:triphosphoribosyl-dephospho-CoA synthase [Mesorhizobium sp. CA13]|uniref:triphosphoribosyl-dephospho-CoA synthase n=1 Tax=unclassified Mesorhizobium TaxID=325217 RepID=UPI00112E2294|nr:MULTISPECIES: triphosphoribosyl-dephospho-CoA synthase [unclassified Mesorhizobium]MBZ9810522.1 triphosphoribosyl-dephospho-CoA synthase [Mesorhizobium sp. ESP-6-2]MBZ9857231.1 triphosphoribosyl-dephospho-CoA synthase [Mesorhizobium sp. CA13]MBZ9869313.1 triphosphoribosyl-dephospho-CoA synthase [Mesorhizobium sp. BR1-1-9]MBZ9944815.1 triphosphoribosyl-dephospho-CoA synthase [Mesorhizobium sp. BR1-1-13]TPM25533.1 triphosphoribosyl-dephospho-CoA synthase [Mesorhizobium sp. B2-2-2]
MTLSRERLRASYKDACRMEIEALKPGNVHLFADGHGMSAAQFMISAEVSSEPLTDPRLSAGQRMLEAVRATRLAVATNTNLGIILLAGPLICAAEMRSGSLQDNLDSLLRALSMDDTRAVFEAIAMAAPGGLGDAANDVRQEPKVHLLEAMREAADRDMIARQYDTCFGDVFGVGLAALVGALARGESGMWPTVFAYMAFVAGFPDSHVVRNHGIEVANQARQDALAVQAALHANGDEPSRIRLLMEFDRRLKADKVNPGTSADLTVATLLVHTLGARLHNRGVGA